MCCVHSALYACVWIYRYIYLGDVGKCLIDFGSVDISFVVNE